ncbi:MAG: carboxypeptidase regulatory-like domain-containing protein [Acidobacteria bacterium]|nr:carboxypeptidase regulatory-like domain-containing protein [Acidobacteriota bacterium]
MSRRYLFVTLFLCLWPGLAQDPRGSIVGQITDSTGAVIPNATVRITHVETNVVATAVSNSQGSYEAPYLLTGAYRLSVEMAGFKTWTRSGIDLRIGDRLQIDIRLELGNVTEVVEVTTSAPVLEATTGTVGQVLDRRQFADLPLRGGSVSTLYAMSPASILTALPFDGPWNVVQASNVSLAGGGVTDFNVDGVSNNSSGGNTSFVPPPDMVQEVKIDTASYDAAIGHARAGSINVSLKSGTNALHGTVGAFVSSGPMMTRNFFTDRFIFDPTTGPVTPEKIKANTPSVRWLRYTAAVGGPLVIPGIYNGKNRTFWMFGYQQHNRNRPVQGQFSVPTLPERTGDFSALLGLGSQYQIYDPMTTKAAGNSRYSRLPLPGNIIPASRIDPMALHILKYFPEPNTAGTRDGLQNYSRSRMETQNLYQPVMRVDHNFSEKHRMFVRYSHSDFKGNFDEIIPDSDVRGRFRERPHRGIAIDNVWVLSPDKVLNVRYGFTYFRDTETFANIGWDLSEFGFPSSLINTLPNSAISFPQIMIGNTLQLGNPGGFTQTDYSHSLLTVLNWSRGNHSIKFGADLRLPLDNSQTYSNVSPRMNFDTAYTKGPVDNSPAAPVGQGLASFLFGIPTSGYVDLNSSRAQSGGFYSTFVQDDWRITRKLTLNLGLRWEYEAQATERYNRDSRQFDFQTVNPIQDQAQANYAKHPIPQIPADQFRTIGGLTFTGINGNPRGIRDAYWPAFMPRFGFAYQVLPRVVMRGGFGMFFGLLGSEFIDVAQPGFNQRTNIVPTLDNGITYAASISNPLPFGVEQPLGAAGGLKTYLGRSPGFYNTDGRRPYSERWSYSLQFQPLDRTVVEIGYLGSRSLRLRTSTNYNPVPRQYLSTSPVRDQATIDLLSARVTNPFLGIDGFQGSTFFNTANTTVAQLLRPLPQFTDLTAGAAAASSWYNALTVRVERRFHRGLQFQANYTWSKTMEALAYLNAGASRPEHVVSNLDRPHRVTLTSIYELPFGAGRPYLSSLRGPLNHIIGGWNLQTVFQMQSGPPLDFGNVIYTGEFSQIALPADQRSLQRWFNTDGFERSSQMQLANNIRYFPSRISSVRAAGINVLDLSVHKNFRMAEHFTLQLRGEAEGALNHPNFDAPNMAPANALFGQVTATQTGQEERRIFVGLKLLF